MSNVIESQDYRDEEELLMQDSHVKNMVDEILETHTGDPLAEFFHDDGTPRHEFMGIANVEYESRGGTANRSLGGVGRAIRRLLIAAQGQETTP